MRGLLLWPVPGVLAVMLLLNPCPALSHGILARISQGPALIITAGFDDGDPVAYAGVEITFKGETLPFQTGQTDRNGRFLFLPDRDGEWTAVINDGMGHRAVVRKIWEDGASSKAVSEGIQRKVQPGLLVRSAAGIGILMGLCLAVRRLFWRRRRSG